MDITSAYINLGYNNENTLNIAVCGKQYIATLDWLISMGLIGDNIIINVFADNDKMYNKNNKNPTDLKYFNNIFKRYKLLFKEVNIFYNSAYKDIGTDVSNIILERNKL